MRMLERHWDWLNRGYKVGLPENLTAIDLSEAARWFYEESEQEMWDYREDFPSLAPAWPLAWYEWGWPRFSRSEGKIIAWPRSRGRFGCLVYAVDVKEGKGAEMLRKDLLPELMREVRAEIITDDITKTGSREADLERRRQTLTEMTKQGVEAKWVLFLMLFAETNNRRVIQGLAEYWGYLDQEGRILPHHVVSLIANSHLGMGLSDGLPLPWCFGVSLLHCKNVVLSEIPVPKKVRRARERKGIPKVVYKTLVIEPLRQQVRNTDAEEKPKGDPIQRALHIVRGHFKDFREKGLFGKYHDIYWWEMHARGKEKLGVIHKDYEIAIEGA